MNNIKYIIRELRGEDLNGLRGFLKTLSNLSEVGNLTIKQAKKIFKETKKENCYIFVAVAEDRQVVGVIKLIIDQKFYHQGGIAGHIEDVVVRKELENIGVARSLIKQAISKAKKIGCYKIILDCRDELVPFYKKFGFNEYENCLRINL